MSQKKVRDEEGVFVAEGPKIINELLGEPGVSPVAVYALPAWISANQALAGRLPEGALSEVTTFELERISFLTTPNEVLAIFRKPVFNNSVDADKSLVLMLDNIQDPGNLGTIIRCADWFGLRKIVCNPGSADCFSPKVVQSTMASIMRVELIYTDLLEYAQKYSVPVYAAALEGKPFTGTKPRNGILVIGNESRGISEEMMQLATNKIMIPRVGKAESLNAAVATGILLSQLTL
ncbi:MAG: RNA methyltransferase [Flavitalea sp.]